jgi:hypothetical protein
MPRADHHGREPQWQSLALDLSLGAGPSQLKCLTMKKKNVAERVGFEPTDGTLEIKILLENCGLLVPSKPLASPFVPVDSASSSVVSQTSASKLV